MELGPGIRAVTIESPYSVGRYTVHNGAVVIADDPLTVRAGPEPDGLVITFHADDHAFAVPDGTTALAWLTHMRVQLVSGKSATTFYCSSTFEEPSSKTMVTPGIDHLDLLLDEPRRGAHIAIGRPRPAGAIIRIDGFDCYCLVDEEHTDRAERFDVPLSLTREWSQFYGEVSHGLAARLRYLRFRRLQAPRVMPWLEGLDVVVVPGEQMSQVVYVSGLYEPCTATVLKSLVAAGNTVVDVGANIGLLTMLASRWVGPTGSVLGFEPSQREFARLQEHVECNNLGNVRPVRAAVGNTEGTAVLRVAGDGDSGLNTLQPRFAHEVPESHTETVPIVRLDSYVRTSGIPKVDVIKIDVEGSEHDVLMGARDTITRDRPSLLIEIAGSAPATGQANRSTMETFLRSLDYVFVAIDGEAGTLRRVPDLASAAENFLAVQPRVLAELQRQLPNAGLKAGPRVLGHRQPGPDTPYLSIILTGRNDGFGGDFNERLFRALEFNHRHLTERGITHEFVFVEWRPVDGRPWLAEVLADRYPELVPHTLTSYVADEAYHEAYSLNPKLQFQEFIAKNIGIRRCRGAFVLTTNTDVFLGRGVLDYLQRRALEPGVLYRVPRIDLKDALDSDRLDWSVLEDERNYDTINRIKPPLFTNASGDFLLLDYDNYCALGGFNEIYRVAKVHMDSNFCLKAYSSGLTLTPLDAPVYHIGRGTLNSQKSLYSDRPQDAPWGDRRWKRAVLYDNDADWGLWRAPMRTAREGVHYLDFSWSAVPSIVALRRVVLPVERHAEPSALSHVVDSAMPLPARAGAPPYPVSVKPRGLPAGVGTEQADHQVFEDGLAVGINQARLAFLASLDLPLAGKRVLDAGCGVGHFTSFYLSRGCRVVGIDGRSENIARMKELYPDVEGLTGDLQTMDLAPLEAFDVVHCFGLLYHLDSPVTALRRLASVCREYLILETMVCDSTAPMMMLADEHLSTNQALAGLACRPSPSFVTMTLDRIGFPFIYGTTAPPRHPDFEFEWRNNLDIGRNGRNLRCMFVASRVPVTCAHLVPLIPGR